MKSKRKKIQPKEEITFPRLVKLELM